VLRQLRSLDYKSGYADWQIEDFTTSFVVQISRCGGPVGVSIPKDGSLSVTDGGSGTML
jgi:glucose/arabinose dehydrogenase